MGIHSKWNWNLFVTLIVIGFLGLVTFLLNAVISGEGNEYYISGKGYKLTPIGSLSTLAVFPIIGLVVWFLHYRQKSSERSFIKKYGSKNKKDK